MADAAVEFQALANALREAGETGLKRELYAAIRDAAVPLAARIESLANLEEHMPDPYVPVLLTNLRVTTRNRATGTEPGVTLVASAPTPRGNRGRQVIRLNQGIIGHPVFGRRSRVNARRWASWEYQEGGMRAGFVDGPVSRAGPAVRDQIAAAVRRVRDQIYTAP